MIERRLSLHDVARYPRPGMAVPKHVEFTPDSRAVAYLASREGTLVQELWLYDVETGERRQVQGSATGAGAAGAISREEELRRERSRLRETGITDFSFARDGDSAGGATVLLVPQDGWLYVAHGDGPLTRLDDSEGALDAALSPDGSHVAFVRADELYVLPTQGGGSARRVTHGAGQGVTNGLAEYIAQEEIGRREGYWWSPDGTRLAYVRADSSHMPVFPIVHQGTDALSVEEHRYPFAGARNAAVQLGVVALAGDTDGVTWMDLGAEQDIYLARVAWRPDGVLTAEIQSRDQRTVRLVAFDAATGAATTLIEERGEPWLNLGAETRFLRAGEIIWASEKTGFRHLYLHDARGRERRALTEGSWTVTGLVAVDEERRVAYVQGTRDGVLERHLYAVPLDGGDVQRLTGEPGWHEAVIAPDFRHWVDTWSSVERAPAVVLRRLAGSDSDVLYGNEGVTAAALGLVVPELTSFQNRDGTTLYAAFYATEAVRTGEERRPLVVSVYGGPRAQTVANRWDLTVDLRAQYLAQQGIVVLKVDNRGSANRGLAFEAPLAGHIGRVEVDDQVDGVRFAAERDYIDSARVGIYGWSYGGYMTCRALMLAPDVFTVGVAGAPVTDWADYDTHYTERYMGLPVANAAGYRDSSVLAHTEALRGALLLIHGLVDENVHFRHTARLIAALTAAGKPYDMVLFPEERHMPRDSKGLEYLERSLVEYLLNRL